MVWVERAFGRFWGFQEGWWSWVASFADNALYPVMFAEYLKFWVSGMTPLQYWLICVAMIAACVWIHVLGTQVVGFSSGLFTLLVLAPFGAMVVLGLPYVSPSRWAAVPRPGLDHLSAWSALLSVVLWNYSGWDNAGCCSGEVRSPDRTCSMAMVTTIIMVIIAYIAPVAVGVGASPDSSRWRAGYFPEVAGAIGGGWLGAWLALGGLVSAVGLFSALLLTSSRVPYAMAARRMLPPLLAQLHPRYGTPWVTILLNGLGSALLIGWASQTDQERGPLVALLQTDMWLYALALGLEVAALVSLRVRNPGLPRPYRIPGGIVGVVLLSTPPVVLCLVSMAISPLSTQFLGAAVVMSGWIAYAIGRSNSQAKETTVT